MNNKKQLIIRSLIGGFVYAGLMAGWDYHDNLPFSVWKFLFYLLFFGGSMGFFEYWQVRRKNQ
jgi:hypothetical protein